MWHFTTYKFGLIYRTGFSFLANPNNVLSFDERLWTLNHPEYSYVWCKVG